jgi:hypothetical protein
MGVLISKIHNISYNIPNLINVQKKKNNGLVIRRMKQNYEPKIIPIDTKTIEMFHY